MNHLSPGFWYQLLCPYYSMASLSFFTNWIFPSSFLQDFISAWLDCSIIFLTLLAKFLINPISYGEWGGGGGSVRRSLTESYQLIAVWEVGCSRMKLSAIRCGLVQSWAVGWGCIKLGTVVQQQTCLQSEKVRGTLGHLGANRLNHCKNCFQTSNLACRYIQQFHLILAYCGITAIRTLMRYFS